MKSKARINILILILLLSSIKLFSQNKAIEHTGDIFLFALPTATLASTLWVNDKDGTKQFMKALLLNQAVTFGLKLVINKARPDNSNNNAFPSGHTSTMFQSASFINKRYGFKYGIPAFILAGFTGYSRIDAKKHDGWDILAGTVVGIASTCLFTTNYQQEHMELSFSSDHNTFLLGFIYKF